ncbi:spore germination protein [Natronincola peptidivorans]|uniref:Spore germination protein n=1 Tax=Natronincola peptidivorans TaxID=426128 RepID=A0A1I0AJM4_9FIRM|nr:endospore germination permease [Natronincola peptidivorans]SES94505.1 spore germination protein [Natronincola peptidivorans]
MYSNNDRITYYQIINILVLTLIGVGVLTLPRELIGMAKTDGWLLLIIGGTISMGIAYIHGYIIKAFPRKKYFDILSLTLTKPIAYLFSVFFIIYLVGTNGFLLRILAEVIKVFLLPRTPIEVIFIGMLFVVAYSARLGIEPLGRITNILFPGLIVFVIAMFALTFANVDFTNLLPIFQTPPDQMLRGLNIVVFSFLGFELLLVFGAFLDKPQKAPRIGPIAVFLVLIVYLILNLSVLANFGVYNTERLIWPTLSVFETIEFPGAFIENVQIIIMSIWVYTIFMTIAPMYLASSILMGQVMGGREQNYFVLPLVPIVYFVALYSDSIADVYKDFGTFSDYTVYFIVLGMPIAILIGMMVRKMLKNKDNQST